LKLPTTPSFRLEDKRALIIGSSSGIGVGCAVALADAGASVVLAARRIDLLDDLKKSLIDKGYKLKLLNLILLKLMK
jgi:NADP-dependent 3-hydroxy acid dehydrogenase YdfG